MNPLVTEARALCAEATEGPWEWIAEHGVLLGAMGTAVAEDGEGYGVQMSKVDGNFIARSRTLIPEMADEIERLEKELAATNRDIQYVSGTLKRALNTQAELDALKADIEAGRLVRLPFKPGDTLYAIIPKICQMDCDTHVSPWKSVAAVIYEDGSVAAMDADENFYKVGTPYDHLTEAEALAAMKEDAHGTDYDH